MRFWVTSLCPVCPLGHGDLSSGSLDRFRGADATRKTVGVTFYGCKEEVEEVRGVV